MKLTIISQKRQTINHLPILFLLVKKVLINIHLHMNHYLIDHHRNNPKVFHQQSKIKFLLQILSKHIKDLQPIITLIKNQLKVINNHIIRIEISNLLSIHNIPNNKETIEI